LLGLFFDPEDGGNTFLQKHLLTFNKLHSVISQKTKLFKKPKETVMPSYMNKNFAVAIFTNKNITMATFTSKWKLLWVHSVLNKIVI
jgi:hypothetical protein